MTGRASLVLLFACSSPVEVGVSVDPAAGVGVAIDGEQRTRWEQTFDSYDEASETRLLIETLIDGEPADRMELPLVCPGCGGDGVDRMGFSLCSNAEGQLIVESTSCSNGGGGCVSDAFTCPAD